MKTGFLMIGILCTIFLGNEFRVPTNSGNHGKPGKSQIKIPFMEKSWKLIKTEIMEKSWNFVKSVENLTARGKLILKSVKHQEKLVQKLDSIDTLH